MGQYDGTQIGPDGKRYDIGDVPTQDPSERRGRILVAHGEAADGDIVWNDPVSGRPEWVPVDEALAYEPTS